MVGHPRSIAGGFVPKTLEVHTSVLVCTGISKSMRSRMLFLVVRNTEAWAMANEEAEGTYYLTAPLTVALPEFSRT